MIYIYYTFLRKEHVIIAFSLSRMEHMKIEGKEVTVFPAKAPEKPLVILNTVENEGKSVYEEVCQRTDMDFSMAVIGDIDWDDEMSPWMIPPLSKKAAPCTGGADRYLDTLTGRILPEIKKHLDYEPAYTALAGYSLAGLFAVYSIYKTGAFARIASASGSFWYPDFLDFVKENEMQRIPERIYFSLGDKEARTRHPVLQSVEKNTTELYEYFKSKEISTIFEINPGNHFQDNIGRMAKGISWMIEN